MQNEIKLKASQQTIDDVIVSHAKILQIAKYSQLYLIKLCVFMLFSKIVWKYFYFYVQF